MTTSRDLDREKAYHEKERMLLQIIDAEYGLIIAEYLTPQEFYQLSYTTLADLVRTRLHHELEDE